MREVMFKTYFPKKNELNEQWHIVDAENAVLGRLATEVAATLRGKSHPNFTPNCDMGDHVIIINAEKIRLTGKKWDDKQYVRHSGYPGGQRFATPKMLKAKSATLIVENAVRGMLPKNRLGRKLFKNLYVYNDGEHPHEAQNPKEVKF